MRQEPEPGRKSWNWEIFSVSLAVKDIQASKLFYERLGFTAFAGDQSQNWPIMKNGDRNGLFQGMIDKNILTFNPGWTSDAQPHLIQSQLFP
jgi:lactoylglutathione lyase